VKFYIILKTGFYLQLKQTVTSVIFDNIIQEKLCELTGVILLLTGVILLPTGVILLLACVILLLTGVILLLACVIFY